MALDEAFDYIRRLDRSAFEVVACKGHEPAEADIAAFESEAGFRLPEEFRQFTMSSLGGLYVEVREALWPRPKPYDVGPFWSMLYAVMVFGIAETIPPWLDLRVRYREFKAEGSGEGLVPFLKLVGDADRYCFDAAGRIIYWSHEEPERREPMDVTFGALLVRELRALEERKQQKVNGEG